VRQEIGHADVATTMGCVSALPKDLRAAVEKAEYTDPGLRSMADLYRPARSKRLRVVDRREQ
jgi:hypothetical protein